MNLTKLWPHTHTHTHTHSSCQWQKITMIKTDTKWGAGGGAVGKRTERKRQKTIQSPYSQFPWQYNKELPWTKAIQSSYSLVSWQMMYNKELPWTMSWKSLPLLWAIHPEREKKRKKNSQARKREQLSATPETHSAKAKAWRRQCVNWHAACEKVVKILLKLQIKPIERHHYGDACKTVCGDSLLYHGDPAD